MIAQLINNFLDWYKRNLKLNHAIVAVLFGWQLLHLFWLTTHVLADRVLGYSLFNPNDFYQFLLVIADYFEIPALLSGTLLYFYSLKEGSVKKNITYIILINSQWLHLFWLTDEYVIEFFKSGSDAILPVWLAFIAILIDYLELPVIYDTIKKFVKDYLK